MTTYVLMVSRVFPATHPRRGELTYFKEKILQNFPGNPSLVFVNPGSYFTGTKVIPDVISEPKLHTLRENYDLWSRRAEKINRGEAVLSLRQWTGSPYNFKRDGSKQREFLQLTKIHVQKCCVRTINNMKFVGVDNKLTNIHDVVKNDGLLVDDFCHWFKKDFDGCVIHFSDLKY